jgi:hypothetical protein
MQEDPIAGTGRDSFRLGSAITIPDVHLLGVLVLFLVRWHVLSQLDDSTVTLSRASY